ncbi:unnamed protein product [Periconia digitata]|uniref:Uncharacterized protein n=1 Tax=Periconia digitata TaxID=1303443 RepID=A0A9W4UDV9_9PLEO|nr:unnamed protein product [Periconia digitata]
MAALFTSRALVVGGGPVLPPFRRLFQVFGAPRVPPSARVLHSRRGVAWDPQLSTLRPPPRLDRISPIALEFLPCAHLIRLDSFHPRANVVLFAHWKPNVSLISPSPLRPARQCESSHVQCFVISLRTGRCGSPKKRSRANYNRPRHSQVP